MKLQRGTTVLGYKLDGVAPMVVDPARCRIRCPICPSEVPNWSSKVPDWLNEVPNLTSNVPDQSSEVPGRFI